MKLIFLLVFLIFDFLAPLASSTTPPTVILDYGRMACKAPIVLETRNWQECVGKCVKEQSCMAAEISPSTPTNCSICPFGMLLAVRKPDANGYLVAYKISLISNSTCDNFSNGQFSLLNPNSTNLTIQYFNSSLDSSGELLRFNYTTKKLCPSGWKMFTREKGNWCLKPFSDSYLTYEQAVSRCKTEKAVMSGPDTIAERDWVYNTTRPVILKNAGDVTQFQIWVDGKRKSSCMTPSLCTGTASFDFADKTLSKKNGYKWTPNNPDGLVKEGTTQSCIAMWMNYFDGLMDDNFCDFKKGEYGQPNMGVRGFVCGKEPG